MDFGRVADVNKVDFTLPDDHGITTQLFKELKKEKSKPEVYIGCAKWGRPDWIGKLYPAATKQTEFLQHYVPHFNSIGLNQNVYRLL